MAASDDLLDYTSKIDALVDRIDALLEQQTQHGTSNTQTVIHKSSWSGFLAGFALAACLASLSITYESSRSVRTEMERGNKDLKDQLRDLNAWNDVNRAKIAKLEAQLSGAGK